jgi:hypothetical protein
MTRIFSKTFSRTSRFTRLFARILEEDGAYVVQVRLDNHTLAGRRTLRGAKSSHIPSNPHQR